GAEERFARNEQDDEVDCLLERLPVGLVRERLHVAAYLLRVPLERSTAQVRCERLHRLEVPRERNLCVHDDLPATREVHHHVRTAPAPLALGRHLLDEVAVRAHSRQLRDPAQRQLAPAPARLRRAHGRRQAAGLLAEGPHLRLEARVGARARLLDLAHVVLVAAQRLLQRADAGVDLLLALPQALLGERQELGVASPEGLTAERREGVAERGLGLLEQAALLEEVLLLRR